ncbi:MAG TPA: thioredoxin [Candidatus Atribacteria bacterium]|jgi:thioredoxin 1|uniref:thioredoxin n=1 Tax=Candidatus Sordicultor fermentans TaxID=1953203 RepID=UPI00169E5F95|nr:thioredoxin [Atribacterota bacterium]NLY06464.1 thioredoxin [Candidatus Atribacteria bacterium]MDI9606869.1 thioredoxin [Atribacterota bacterium]MDY0134733.1 thioredoxin [Atribacterota bacterium]HOA99490.1 thioredoxin [Candidatus Atribacteria bacterium]
MIELNKDNFKEEVLDSEIPVLVDFWATWCTPCRMMAPIIEDIANSWQGKVKVCKLNTDDAPEIAIKYGIQAIPTLLIFNGGKEVGRIVGYVPKKTVEEKLQDIIKP